MLGMRKFIRRRRASALLAIYVAYTLAIEAVMASVGLGMSAIAAPEQAAFAICGFPTSDGNYVMDHSALIYLMGPNDEFVTPIAYQEADAWALAKLRSLAALTPSA